MLSPETVKKSMLLSKENRVAGELEGVKTRLELDRLPQKSLEIQGFSGKAVFCLSKILGGL